MEKIPTAEEFISKNLTDFWEGGKAQYRGEDVAEAMIEFAKLHVKATCEAIANEYYPKDKENFEIVAARFINAYPPENIK
jgi:hypothetical protein